MISRIWRDRFWRWLIPCALIAGILLRTLFIEDMEFKEDEELNFGYSQLHWGALPWLGMPSGVYVPNPGMSVWVFTILGRLCGVTTPLGLERALQLFALLGVCLILPFAYRFVRDEEREPWLWAFALAMVNPFLIYIHRKLWPEPFLPFFTMLTLMGLWRRDRFWGAFAWGLFGAVLGQIHMSGFFFALGIVLWVLFWGKGFRRASWKGWFLGSTLGALPLIPWAYEVVTHPVKEAVVSGAGEALQLKYWVFWITDPLGLHLGNPLGLLRSQSSLGQIADFARYPLIGGQATWLIGAAHAVLAVAAAWIVVGGLARLVATGAVRGWARLRDAWIGRSSETAFAQESALWGFGALMTASTVRIRRYYMMVNFPLEFIWLARLALAGRSLLVARRWLLLLWICEALISAGFVGYVHVNGGSEQGDYGKAYHRVIEERGK